MKMFSKSITVLLIMLLATPAFAGERQSAFDANGDGQITFEEGMQRLEASARGCI